MKTAIALSLTILVLGFMVDPFGMTTRNQQNVALALQVAQIEAQAKVSVATVWTDALIRIAFLLISGFLIFCLLALTNRIFLYFSEQNKFHENYRPQMENERVFRPENMRFLREYAENRGGYVVVREGEFYMMTPGNSPKKLLIRRKGG